MRILLTRDEIHQALTTNMQDWKQYADIVEAQDLNAELTPDELITICSSQFFDDINDTEQDVIDVLDTHFIDVELHIYARETFILIHNIYNK